MHQHELPNWLSRIHGLVSSPGDFGNSSINLARRPTIWEPGVWIGVHKWAVTSLVVSAIECARFMEMVAVSTIIHTQFDDHPLVMIQNHPFWRKQIQVKFLRSVSVNINYNIFIGECCHLTSWLTSQQVPAEASRLQAITTSQHIATNGRVYHPQVILKAKRRVGSRKHPESRALWCWDPGQLSLGTTMDHPKLRELRVLINGRW